MNLPELQKQIKEKTLDKLYIFLGEEIAVQKIYINKMAEISNLEIQYVEDFKSIYRNLKTNDIFNTIKLYVILDDTEFIKNEKAWAELESNLDGDNIIIFKFNNLDKRSKFYKAYENKLVEFNKLSDEILTKYIQKEIPELYPINCKKLIDICGNNYNQILLEIDKIKNFEDERLNDYNDIFNYLDNIGAFHKEVADITFEFIEKVLIRDIKAVFDLQKKLKQIGESNIKLLSLLYTNFKTILLIQSCNSSDICKVTGLQYYQVKYNQDKLNYYSIGELVRAIKLIQKAEEGIKTGKIDEDITIDYILVNIL